MLRPRTLFLLACVLYYMDSAYGGPIRAAGVAKWGALGLLLFSCLGLRGNPRAARGTPDLMLMGLFTVLAFTSSAMAVLPLLPMVPYELIAMLAVIFGMRRLALAWIVSGGWSDYERVLIQLARLVTYTSAPMLLLGISLGRSAGRFSAWFANPNTLGMVLLLLWPVVLVRALRNPRRGIWSERLLALLMLGVVVATGSRSAAFGIVISTLVVLWGTRRVTTNTVFACGFVLLLLAVTWSSLRPVLRDVPGLGRLMREDLVQVTTDETGQVRFAGSGREQAWPLAIQLIEEKPIFGHGWGSERWLLWQNWQVLLFHEGHTVHNSYLSLGIQVGFAGAVPLLLVLLLQVGRGWATVSVGRARHAPDEMAVPCFAILVSGMAHGMFESSLFSSGNSNTLVFWTAAFVAGVPRRVLSASPRSVPIPVKADAAT